MSPGVDTNLFIWTLGWNAHAFLHRPTALFEANTFFPFHDSLAFSENLIGSSLIAAPIIWLGGGSVLAMNLVALSSIPLSALGGFRLARELDASRHAALVAGARVWFRTTAFFPARSNSSHDRSLDPVRARFCARLPEAGSGAGSAPGTGVLHAPGAVQRSRGSISVGGAGRPPALPRSSWLTAGNRSRDP